MQGNRFCLTSTSTKKFTLARQLIDYDCIILNFSSFITSVVTNNEIVMLINLWYSHVKYKIFIKVLPI